MDFGIFDHLDHGGQPLDRFYEDRLRLLALYDRSGFHAYHLAEHHFTPLGMAPSPSVFLSAVAQRTERIRFGPMVYCLSLYHPLRVAEEICMLDQMSGGRLELGLGPGISPIELGYLGVEGDDVRARYREAYQVVLQALAADELTHKGDYFQIDAAPITLHPVQRPHPPLWSGLVNPASAAWPAENAINIMTNQPPARVREITDAYRTAWAAAGNREADLPRLAMTRHVVIADTHDEAVAAGRRAYLVWRSSFMKLWDRHGRQPIGVTLPEDFDGLLAGGVGIAGTADEVRDEIQRQIGATSVNHFVCRFAFGDLGFDEVVRSVELFNAAVRPAMAAKAA